MNREREWERENIKMFVLVANIQKKGDNEDVDKIEKRNEMSAKSVALGLLSDIN